MSKIWVVAVREYRAAVRTKSFIISLLLMPIFMGGSIVIQVFLKEQTDSKDKSFAVVDRTPGAQVAALLKTAAEKRNQEITEKAGKRPKPRFLLDVVPPGSNPPEQRFELSEQVRQGRYWGFVEIGPDVTRALLPGKAPDPDRWYLRYQTDHPTYQDFPNWLRIQLIVAISSVQSHLPTEVIERQIDNQQLLSLRVEGLSKKDKQGNIIEPKTEDLIARFAIPFVLVMMMFFVVTMGASPGMQAVVEEKMQRIAEVLLGSLPPFQLMLGKLLGLMGVTLTIAALYLGGSYWVAMKYDLAKFLTGPLLTWYVVFQTLAVLMYGSIFLAIGAAATDLKETQTLVMPVMLVAVLPIFILSVALEDPNNPLVVGVSLFPPSTPFLMMARLAIPPGPPLWQAVLAFFLVLAMTLGCVYVAGRIFRVGILIQGKGAKFSQLFRWVFRG